MDAAPIEPILRFQVTAINYTINTPQDKRRIKANSSQDEQDKLFPPEAVSQAAERGIYLYEKYGGTQKFRIPQLLASASPISIRDIYEILDYFENNEFNTRERGWGYENEPSVDWIRWLMMGGDYGWTWARIVKRIRTAKIEIPK